MQPQGIEALLRAEHPDAIPPSPQFSLRYNPAHDTLTILIGPQDRWAVREVRTGDETLHLDETGTLIRLEYHAARRRFSPSWLQRFAQRGRWRRALGLP